MKKLLLGLLMIFFICSMELVSLNDLRYELFSNLIRLHIVANSDRSCDQKVKLEIRDNILKYAEDSGEIPTAATMELIANKTLLNAGFSYGSRACFGVFDFPEKKYELLCLPNGEYRAAKIILGAGKGKNWWCVLSPPVCFTKSAVSVKEEELKNNLSEQTYKTVTDENLHYRFKLLEMAENLFEKN